jgi:hypothetical protein
MNNLTPERLAEIEKRCNKFRGSGYMWDRFAQYAVVDLGDLLSEIKRLREENNDQTRQSAEQVLALLEDRPIDGEYIHAVHCNADRREPVGAVGCSCRLGKRIRALAIREAERVGAVIQNEKLSAQLSDVTAQYKHCHSLYSERIGLTDRLGRLVESLQAQLSDALSANETANKMIGAQADENDRTCKNLLAQLSDAQAALKVSQEAVVSAVNYINGLAFTHRRSCNYDPDGHHVESDFCTCNLSERRVQRNKKLDELTAALQPGRR